MESIDSKKKNLAEKKDIEKSLYKSKRSILAGLIFLCITIIVALVVRFIWNPVWWVYVLILSAGLYELIGDLVNIWYCKKKIKSLT